MEYWQRQLILYVQGYYARNMCERDARLFAEHHSGVHAHRLTSSMFRQFMHSTAKLLGEDIESNNIGELLIAISRGATGVVVPTDIDTFADGIIKKRAHADAACLAKVPV